MVRVLIVISLILHLSYYTNDVLSQENVTAKAEISRNCRERNRLINSENGDLYALIDATLGEKLILLCHYCNENDDGRPKIWYKVDEIEVSHAHEVNLGMENNASMNRIHVNPEHSLIIKNISQTDVGLYYCVRYETQDIDEKYNYLVELVHSENITAFESGNETDWEKYKEDYFVALNNLLRTSEGTEFLYLRNNLSIQAELITQWDPWTPCEVCGRAQGDGRRRKMGLCRLKLTHKRSNIFALNADESFLLHAHAVSCRSTILGRVLPGVSNRTKVIPNFQHVEKCDGICNPDAEGVNTGWKVGKTKEFKYRKIFVLTHSDSIAVTCPESTIDNEIVWKFNGYVIKRGHPFVNKKDPDAEPRIIVDLFNTLHLMNAEPSDAGNYTCEVEKIRMLRMNVFITTKSRLISHEMVRHLYYLGFVLCLTTTCYCAGLVITCSRKSAFKDYEELREIHAKDENSDDFLMG